MFQNIDSRCLAMILAITKVKNDGVLQKGNGMKS
jgi:hypothetical protein